VAYCHPSSTGNATIATPVHSTISHSRDHRRAGGARCRRHRAGCTEIPFLVSADDSPVPLFDTGELHTRAAVELALVEG